MTILDEIRWRIAVEVVKPAIDKVKKQFSFIYGPIIAVAGIRLQLALNWILSLNTSLRSWITNKIQEAIDASEDTGGGWFGWIGDIVGSVLDAIGDVFVKVVELAGRIRDVVVDWWVDTYEAVLSTVSSMIDASLDFVSDAFKSFTNWLVEIGTSVAKFISSAIAAAINVVSAVVDTVIENVSGILNTIADYLLPAISNIQDAMTDLLISITEDITETANKLVLLIAEETVKIMDAIDKATEAIESRIPDIAGTVLDALLLVNPVFAFFTYLLSADLSRDPRIQENIDERREIQKDINKIIDGLD